MRIVVNFCFFFFILMDFHSAKKKKKKLDSLLKLECISCIMLLIFATIISYLCDFISLYICACAIKNGP